MSGALPPLQLVELRTSSSTEKGSNCALLCPLSSADGVQAAKEELERTFAMQMARHGSSRHFYPYAYVVREPTGRLVSGGQGDGEPSGRAQEVLLHELCKDITPSYRLVGVLIQLVIRLPTDSQTSSSQLTSLYAELASELLKECHEVVLYRKLHSIMTAGKFGSSIAVNALEDQLLIERSIRKDLLLASSSTGGGEGGEKRRKGGEQSEEEGGGGGGGGEVWMASTPSGIQGRLTRRAMELLLPPELLDIPPSGSIETEFGAHRVVRLGDVFYKVGVGGFVAENFIVKGSDPIFPAYEYMSNTLNRIAVGPQCPETQLIVLQKRGAEHLQVGVMASKAVTGVSMDRVWMVCDKLARKIELKSYSDACLNALISFPNDAKPDNYLLEVASVSAPVPGEMRTIESIESLRVRPLDNDRSMVADTLGCTGGRAVGHTLLGMRCFLFLQEELLVQPIHAESRERFLQQTPLEVMARWLQELHVYDKWVRSIDLTEDSERYWALPVKATEGTSERIFRRITRIQELLRGDEDLTHKRLWEETEPIAAGVYMHVRRQTEERLGRSMSRMEEVMAFIDPEHDNLYQRLPAVEDIPTLAKHWADLSRYSHPTNLYDNLDSMVDLTTVTVTGMAAELLHALDFGLGAHVGDAETALEVCATHLSFVADMHIRNCEVLTDSRLLELAVVCSGWQTLSLHRCHSVTPDGIAALLSMPQHAGLALTVSDCAGLLAPEALSQLAGLCGYSGTKLSLLSPVGSYLLSAGQQSSEEIRPLLSAAQNADMESIRLLLASGVSSVDQADADGNTALHLAVGSERCSADLVDLLCASGAQEALLAVNGRGHTVLQVAARVCSSPTLFQHLLDRCGKTTEEVDAISKGTGSLLQCAVASANVAILRTLLEAGATAELQEEDTAAAILAFMPRHPRDATATAMIELFLEKTGFAYLESFIGLLEVGDDEHFLQQQLNSVLSEEDGSEEAIGRQNAVRSISLMSLATRQMCGAEEEGWKACDLSAAVSYLAAAVTLAEGMGSAVYRVLLFQHMETAVLLFIERTRQLIAAAWEDDEDEEEEEEPRRRNSSVTRMPDVKEDEEKSFLLAPVDLSCLRGPHLPLRHYWKAVKAKASPSGRKLSKSSSKGKKQEKQCRGLAVTFSQILSDWSAMFQAADVAGAPPVRMELVGLGSLALGSVLPFCRVSVAVLLEESYPRKEEAVYALSLLEWCHLLSLCMGQTNSSALKLLGLGSVLTSGFGIHRPLHCAPGRSGQALEPCGVDQRLLSVSWLEETWSSRAPGVRGKNLLPGMVRSLHGGEESLVPEAGIGIGSAWVEDVLMDVAERMEEVRRMDGVAVCTSLADLWLLVMRPFHFLSFCLPEKLQGAAYEEDMREAVHLLVCLATDVHVKERRSIEFLTLVPEVEEEDGSYGDAVCFLEGELGSIVEGRLAAIWQFLLRFSAAIEAVAVTKAEEEAVADLLSAAYEATCERKELAVGFTKEQLGDEEAAMKVYAEVKEEEETEVRVEALMGLARLQFHKKPVEAFKECTAAADLLASSQERAEHLVKAKCLFFAGVAALAKAADGNPIITAEVGREKLEAAEGVLEAALQKGQSGMSKLLTGDTTVKAEASLSQPLGMLDMSGRLLCFWQRRIASRLLLLNFYAAAAPEEMCLTMRKQSSQGPWRRATMAGP